MATIKENEKGKIDFFDIEDTLISIKKDIEALKIASKLLYEQAPETTKGNNAKLFIVLSDTIEKNFQELEKIVYGE